MALVAAAITIVTLIVACFVAVERLDRRFSRRPAGHRTHSWEIQPNEDDPEFLEFIERKVRELLEPGE